MGAILIDHLYIIICSSGFMEFVKDERTIEEIRASILGIKSCSNCQEQVSLYANNKEKLCSKCASPSEDSQWDKYDKSIECGFTHDESLVVFN